MKKIEIVLLLILVSFTAKIRAENSVKTHMQEAMKNYVMLMPYMHSNELVRDKNIIKYLSGLEDSLLKASHGNMIKGPNFSPSLSVIIDSIKSIKKSHIEKNFSYSKHRLKRVISTCISCHSQLPQKSYKKIKHSYDNVFNKFIIKNNDKAMLSYFLRDYEASLYHLKKEISENRLDVSRSIYVEHLYKQILKVYLVNMNDKLGAVKYFSSQRQILKENERDFELLSNWIISLNSWTNVENNNLSKSTLQKLIGKFLVSKEKEIINRSLPEHLVTLYFMRGVISNYMISNQVSDYNPELLYWLGIIENHSNQIYLYSLGDLYLKECILRYPKTKIAKKCFDVYKESITLGFTGSSGINVPKGIQMELNQLKSSLSK